MTLEQAGQPAARFNERAEVPSLFLENSRAFDWVAIATYLGKPEAAPLLEKVCKLTQWRRMMGKHCGSTAQWTCTLKGTRGRVAGPLGAHLLLATVNLVAWGYQGQAVMLARGRASKRATGCTILNPKP